MKMPKYVEHENVIYRANHGQPINYMNERLVGGKWQKVSEGGAKAAAFGRPMSEAEARAFHGKGWPEEEAAPAAKDSDHTT
jgi:hypothetical protein